MSDQEWLRMVLFITVIGTLWLGGKYLSKYVENRSNKPRSELTRTEKLVLTAYWTVIIGAAVLFVIAVAGSALYNCSSGPSRQPILRQPGYHAPHYEPEEDDMKRDYWEPEEDDMKRDYWLPAPR